MSGRKPEVEHLVGLVEHQHRQPAELQVALLGQVEQPARRADDHVGTGLQRLDLRLVRTAAVDRYDTQRAVSGGQVLGGVGQVAVHLKAQLAGGDDDQRPGRAGQRALGVAGDAVQQRHTERERLAHAGAGLADQVVAGQRQRQGQLLDSKGMFNAVLG